MADTKIGRPATKSAIFQTLSEETGLARKDVAALFEALGKLIRRELSKKGPGVLTLPTGLLKIKRVHKPATSAREGRNPATGETIMIKAKPARTVVKAQPLKNLKEMV